MISVGMKVYSQKFAYCQEVKFGNNKNKDSFVMEYNYKLQEVVLFCYGRYIEILGSSCRKYLRNISRLSYYQTTFKIDSEHRFWVNILISPVFILLSLKVKKTRGFLMVSEILLTDLVVVVSTKVFPQVSSQCSLFSARLSPVFSLSRETCRKLEIVSKLHLLY